MTDVIEALERAYVEGTTESLADAARVLVEARSRFTRDGLPDWCGRSWGYRQLVTAARDELALPRGEWVRMCNAIRYHVSIEVRIRVAPETVAAIGLLRENGIERSGNAQKARSAELRAYRELFKTA
jgi:hypothetical protein